MHEDARCSSGGDRTISESDTSTTTTASTTKIISLTNIRSACSQMTGTSQSLRLRNYPQLHFTTVCAYGTSDRAYEHNMKSNQDSKALREDEHHTSRASYVHYTVP